MTSMPLRHTFSRLTTQYSHYKRLPQHHLQPCLQTRHFHPSRRKLQDAFPNHYETLELPTSATPAEIKKQFYALSKKYHPDVNRDSSASERFVKISEAYHVLGSADKKGRYDRDFQRAHATPSTRSGSHTSHSQRSGPAGGRPPSGLSKRRSQFRGPPPSFYAQGGYGSQGAKRQRAQADADARHQASSDSNHPGGLGSQPNFTGTGGFSPGDGSAYYDPDPDLPYFDKASHRRTHDNLGARRESRMGADAGPRAGPSNAGGSLIANFLIVTAVVATATVVATVMVDMAMGAGRRKKDVRGDG